MKTETTMNAIQAFLCQVNNVNSQSLLNWGCSKGLPSSHAISRSRVTYSAKILRTSHLVIVHQKDDLTSRATDTLNRRPDDQALLEMLSSC